MMRLSVHQLHDAIGGRLRSALPPAHGAQAEVIRRVVTDSRQARGGDVFFALPGTRYNGSEFIDDAYSRGATGVVAGGGSIEPEKGRFCIEVNDPLAALWKLAQWNRARMPGDVVAVTGSVGKTTTREMIHTVLDQVLHGSASPHNYNNHVGVPLSLLEIAPDDDYAVIEMAASAPGEIARLAELSRANIGVITRIGDAHLAGFGSREAIASGKAELLDHLPADGLAVLNGDDPQLRRLAGRCRCPIVWVGRSVQCDLVATEIHSADGRLAFSVDQARFVVPVWGRHFLSGALAAVAVGRQLGLADATIADALAGFQGQPMRCEVIRRDGLTLINDTYNSSPIGMRAALDLVREMPVASRKIVVFGDMAELGEEAGDVHRQIGSEAISRAGADVLVACGQWADEVVAGAVSAGMPRSKAIACHDREQAQRHLEVMIATGDTILVKGARSLGLEHLVAVLQVRQPAVQLRAA